MSDVPEITMADKIAMLRVALPKGMSAGSSGEIKMKSPRKDGPPELWPYSSKTIVQDSSLPASSPMPEEPVGNATFNQNHPWKVVANGEKTPASTPWKVLTGIVYGWVDGVPFPISLLEYEFEVLVTKYVLLHLVMDGDNLVSAEFELSDDLIDDTVTDKYLEVALVDPAIVQNQFLWEHVRLPLTDKIKHPWEITTASAASSVDVAAGIVATQGVFTEALAVTVGPELALAVADGDYVYISIPRNSSTREQDGTIEILAASTLPDSDETTQYGELGRVTVVDGIVTVINQRRFHNISIFEALAVSNGEFQYAPLEMFGRTPYALP